MIWVAIFGGIALCAFGALAIYAAVIAGRAAEDDDGQKPEHWGT